MPLYCMLAYLLVDRMAVVDHIGGSHKPVVGSLAVHRADLLFRTAGYLCEERKTLSSRRNGGNRMQSNLKR